MDILTMADVLALDMIGHAAERNETVARLMPDGTIIQGVARSIGTEGFLSGIGTDVRDQFLRVTSGGIEHAWPVRDLMRQIPDGEFVIV